MSLSSDSSSSEDEIDFQKEAQKINNKLLPKKSVDKYTACYNDFIKWTKEKKASSIDGNVMLVYFNELSEKFQPPTLWTRWSMLRKMLSVNNNINIKQFEKLSSFMKNNSKGYAPKKAAIFSMEEITTFINKAPDNIYLAMKTILTFGFLGALRSAEICDVRVDDVKDKNGEYIVYVKNTKNHYPRYFIIGKEYYRIVKNYISKRPENTESDRFFLYYQQGTCKRQVIGKNKIGEVPNTIAHFLNLENPERYTGHSFRRTSATLLAETGVNLTTLKQHGGWKSSTVAEGYIEHSLKNKENIYHQIINTDRPSTSDVNIVEEKEEEQGITDNNKNTTEHETNEQNTSSPPPISLSTSPPLPTKNIIIPETPENSTELLDVNINTKKRKSSEPMNEQLNRKMNRSKTPKPRQNNLTRELKTIEPNITFSGCNIKNITINYHNKQ